VDGIDPLVFGGRFYLDDGGASVDEGGEEGAGDIGDLDFAGEEGGVVGREGVGAEAGNAVSKLWRGGDMVFGVEWRLKGDGLER